MVLQHDQEVVFAGHKIELDIPFPSVYGTVTEDRTWSIISLGPPVVNKRYSVTKPTNLDACITAMSYNYMS